MRRFILSAFLLALIRFHAAAQAHAVTVVDPETELSGCMTLVSSFAEPHRRLPIIPGYTAARVVHSTKFELSIYVALLGSFAEP